MPSVLFSIIMIRHPIGPFTLAKTKIQKTWVYCTVYTARKTHNFFLGGARKAHARKKPESHTVFLVRGAHARLLSTFDRPYSVQYVAGRGWFRGRSRPMWPETRIIPARGEQVFTLAKNQWKTGGVSKNHTSEVGFSILFFCAVFRGSCLATSN